MKILAVRGENLASLADRFTIDFTAPPLADAGIFAITGRTGSGKSTLLDAICLALYDKIPRTPRYEKKSTAKADKTNGSFLFAHDVRTILRSSAVSCFAEVDFIAGDQKKYRARWQVRRARLKISGNILPQEISLIAIASGNRIGGKKTETLKEIQKLIGLEFEQFSRTVLLSQGEFDAFLKARENERSILLEALTGTDIYSQISIAAHQRAREEKNALALINTQLGEHRPLTKEERDIAQRHHDQLASKTVAIQKILLRLQNDLEWYQQQKILQEKVSQAQAALASAQNAESKSQPLKARLQLIGKAHSLGPFKQNVDRSRQHSQVLDNELARLIKSSKQATAETISRERESQEAGNNLEQAKQAWQNAQEELKKATILDSQLQSKLDAKNTATIDAKAVRERLKTVGKDEKTLLANRQAVITTNNKNAQWLQQNGHWQILVDGFEAVVQDIRQISANGQAIATEKHIIVTAKKVWENSQRQIAELEQKQQHIQEAITADEARLQPLLERMKQAPNLINLQEKLQENHLQIALVTQLITNLEQIETLQKQLGKQQAGCQLNDQEIVQFTNHKTEATQKSTTLAIQLEEARRADQLAKATAGEAALGLRALLLADEPCPVCGAQEHPIINNSEQFNQLADMQAQRVAQLQKQEQQFRQSQEEWTKKLQKSQTEREHARQTMERLEAELATVTKLWQDSYPKLSPATVDPATLTTLPDQAGKKLLQESLDRLKNRVQADELSIKTCLTDQERQTTIARSLNNNQKQLSQTEKQLLANQAQLKTAIQQVETAEKTIAIHQHNLDTSQQRVTKQKLIKDDWLLTNFAKPEQIIGNLQNMQKIWLERTQATQAASESLEKIATALQTLKGEQHGAREELARIEGVLQAVQTDIDALQIKRNLIFNGQSSQQIRTTLETARNLAQDNLQEKFHALANSQKELARLKALTDDLEIRCKQAAVDRLAAEKKLAEKCAAIGMSHDELHQGLAVDPAELATQLKQIEALQAAVTKQTHNLEYHQHTLTDHNANNMPPLDATTLATCKTQQEACLIVENKQLAAAFSVLHNDDNNIKRSSSLLQKLEKQQEKTVLWEKMNDLIGSDKGDKFRKFAQSLTLDRLIALANTHLAELTPRYRLQRALEGDLSLQVVDMEMGDEVRGVANLSGGERFLTSLAMALGLAGMSGNRGVQVESLFIDEGFGALDEASLNMAVSALEALQATGRTIGIISHIPVLTERIGVQIQIKPQGGGKSQIVLEPSLA